MHSGQGERVSQVRVRLLSILVVFSMQFSDSNLVPRHQNSLTSALLGSMTLSVLSRLAWCLGCQVYRLAWWWDWHRRAADLLWGGRACPFAQPGALWGLLSLHQPKLRPQKLPAPISLPDISGNPVAFLFQPGFLSSMIPLLFFLMPEIFQI